MTLKKAGAFLLIIILALALASQRGDAQTMMPKTAIEHAKQTGRLPLWISVRDTFRLEPDFRRKRIYLCLVDAESGDRFVTWGPLPTWSELLATGLWTFSESTPGTLDDIRYCFPEPLP